MENKKIDLLFGFVVIAFLIVTLFLIKDFKTTRSNDYKEYTAVIRNIVISKNGKIRILAERLAAEEKENQDLHTTLGETRNDLDNLTKKLAQQAVPAPPTAGSASAAATAPAK